GALPPAALLGAPTRRAAPAPAPAPAAPPTGGPDTARASPARRRRTSGSPVDVSHHGVERRGDGDQVADRGTAHAGRRGLKGGEARRPELHAPRLRAAVRDEV